MGLSASFEGVEDDGIKYQLCAGWERERGKGAWAAQPLSTGTEAEPPLTSSQLYGTHSQR